MRGVAAVRGRCSLALLLLTLPLAVAVTATPSPPPGGRGIAGAAPAGPTAGPVVPALPDDADLAARLLEVEDGRDVDASALLGHPDAAVRARAALAAGRGGWPARHATLLTLLGDEDAGVRRAAAFALGSLDFEIEPELGVARRERAATQLAGLLTDSPEVVLGAALALGRLRVPAAAAPLGALLQARAELAPEAAAAGLWALGRTPGADPATIVGWLQHGDPRVRLAAVGALVRGGDPNVLPALTTRLDDPEPAVRAAAVRALGARAPGLLERRLDGLLRERAPQVALAALAHLQSGAGIDETGADRLAAVLRHSLDRDLDVRRAALAALGPLAPRRAAAADRLLQALQEPEPAVRATALRALSAAGDEPAQRALQWARERWRSPSPATLHGVEAEALATALARSDAGEERAWLRELATASDPRLWQAAYPRLLESEPLAAWELTRGWLRPPDGERAPWAVWGALQLFRAHRLPAEPERPALVDDVWNVLRATASRAQARTRGLALELIAGLAPELLERRVEYLAGLPWRDLPSTLRDLGLAWPTGTAGGVGPGEAGEHLRAARRVLALRDRPPALRLTSPRGDAVVGLRVDWAPLAVLDVLERAGEPGGVELTVGDGAAGEGAVGLATGDWPLQPGWPPATLPSLAEAGMARRHRATGPPGTGTWSLVRWASPGPAGEVWGLVLEGSRAVERLQPGDRVRLQREAEP